MRAPADDVQPESDPQTNQRAADSSPMSRSGTSYCSATACRFSPSSPTTGPGRESPSPRRGPRDDGPGRRRGRPRARSRRGFVRRLLECGLQVVESLRSAVAICIRRVMTQRAPAVCDVHPGRQRVVPPRRCTAHHGLRPRRETPVQRKGKSEHQPPLTVLRDLLTRPRTARRARRRSGRLLRRRWGQPAGRQR